MRHLNGQRLQVAHVRVVLCACGLSLLLGRSAPSQITTPEQPGQEASDPSTEPPSGFDTLANQQAALAEKYRQLEVLMLKMAEFDAGSNPRRAALLKQALADSKDKHIRLQMEALATRIRQQQLQRAVDDQSQVRDDLKLLLELLLSENREDRLRNEQTRIREYIKELERILRQQRGIQGRTEGGGDPLQLAKDQDAVADRTGELAETIEQNEGSPAAEDGAPDAGAGEADSAEPSAPSEEPSREDTPQEDADRDRDDTPRDREDSDRTDEETPGSNNGEDDPSSNDGQPNPSEGESPSSDSPADSSSTPDPDSPSDGGSPSDSSSPPTPAPPGSSQGQPGEGGSPPSGAESPAAPPSAPGQQRIAEAEKRMRQAQERLEEAERTQAIEEQEEARRLLEEAKAELEEILRQLREEEIQRTLAQLEERFRRMLEAELKIYEETQRLSKIPDEERNNQIVIQSGKLSLEQRRLVGEADKALLLLREEGSSVAFPESVEQMRADMDQVAQRLAEIKLERITLGLEEDIIAALEEMIEALQKAQQDAEQRRQQQTPPQSMSPQDQPLVDAIAELKMIRALQMRVNTRTQRYARLLDDPEHPIGQATNNDLVESLGRLAEREARIRQITRDIVLGKNQ